MAIVWFEISRRWRVDLTSAPKKNLSSRAPTTDIWYMASWASRSREITLFKFPLNFFAQCSRPRFSKGARKISAGDAEAEKEKKLQVPRRGKSITKCVGNCFGYSQLVSSSARLSANPRCTKRTKPTSSSPVIFCCAFAMGKRYFRFANFSTGEMHCEIKTCETLPWLTVGIWI